MKRMIIPLVMVLIAPILCFPQAIENIDYISPFNEDVAAIKKGNLWAFIDASGTMIIDFRDDVVVTKNGDEDYPIFKNDRCLISHMKDGINYFGYIDKTGKTVIEPQFLNATPFENNVAVVLKLTEEVYARTVSDPAKLLQSAQGAGLHSTLVSGSGGPGL